MSLYDQLSDLLEEYGFGLQGLQTESEPSEALFLKPRPGASVYVTVPLDCDVITDSVIETIMATAQIPIIKWRHLLLKSQAIEESEEQE